MHRQEALVSNLPETVLTIFQDAIDSANKGLINWLFKHRSVKLLSLLSLPYTLPADVVYATFTKFIGNVPKLRNNLLDLSRFFLEQISVLFPKISVYSPQTILPQTIRCRLAITEYGSNIYDIEAVEDTDSLYKKQKNLNLTLQYNELQPWKELSNKSNCVINMSDLTNVDDTFENILQVTSDQEAVMAYYYMDENNKVRVTEIFDVTDSESHAMMTLDEIEANTKLQFDDWDDPALLSQQTFNDVVTESLYTEENLQSIGDFSDISLEDDLLDGSNIFSDPESEWGVSKSSQEVDAAKPPDSRPEVDQPTVTT